MRAAVLGALVVAVAATGCSSGTAKITTSPDSGAGGPPEADGGLDAGTAPDAGTDAGTDAGIDAGLDAGMDGGLDAGVDAGFTVLPLVYVGSRDGHIYIYGFDEDAGTLRAQGSFDAGMNPSFLALHPTRPLLYAVDETTPGTLSAFALDEATGTLTSLGQAPSGGNRPVYVGFDRTGQLALVANFDTGTVASLHVQSTGAPNQLADTELAGVQPHQLVTDRSNRWAFAPCLGSNTVAQYALDADAGLLTPNPAAPNFAPDAGAGPRHLDFRPDNRFAYLIDETSSTLTTCSFDATTGRLTAVQTVSTLPSGFTGTNTGAEVAVHPNGRFVYASNRGDDSLAVFSADPQSGTLTLIGHTKTQGATPRSFALSPDGRFLIVANQDAGLLVGFRVDPSSGLLTLSGPLAMVTFPEFVGFRPQTVP